MKKLLQIAFAITLCFAMITRKTFAQVPVNDNCSGSIYLTSHSTCLPVAGTLAGATNSVSYPFCDSISGKDVWYHFIACSIAESVVVTGSTDFRAAIQVYVGTCGLLMTIDCDSTVVMGDTLVDNLNSLIVGLTYYVRVFDFSLDVPATPTFTICITGCSTTSLESIQNNNVVSIFQNPTTNKIAIESATPATSFELRDITGKLLMRDAINTKRFEIDLSNYSSGIYFLTLNTKEGAVHRKVVKE